jgi:DNA-binding NarL/FixJ family response regulator
MTEAGMMKSPREPPADGDRVRVLLVEDELIIAESLKRALIAHGYAVQPIVVSGEAAVLAVMESEPDVVLMDIRLKGDIDGITAADRIRGTRDVPLIYITAYGDDATLDRAKLTRPDGYLMKPVKERELKAVIETALYRHRHWQISPVGQEPAAAPAPAGAKLTPREREVLKMIASGLTSKEIAAALRIGVRTVETHRENLFTKLQLHSSAELVRYAVRHGIIDF